MKRTFGRGRRSRRETLFSDRIRFNWGYHDGAAETFGGSARLMVDGPASDHSVRVVSKAFDPSYHAGYGFGVRDAKSGAYLPGRSLSEDAWREFKSSGGGGGAVMSEERIGPVEPGDRIAVRNAPPFPWDYGKVLAVGGGVVVAMLERNPLVAGSGGRERFSVDDPRLAVVGRYPVWRGGEVERFPGHVHRVRGATAMERVEHLAKQCAVCGACLSHRDEIERAYEETHRPIGEVPR